MSIKDIAIGVAKEHIDSHGATFELVLLQGKGKYLAAITHPKLLNNIEETIIISELSQSLAEEYMHCKIHALAAKLIAKLYPHL